MTSYTPESLQRLLADAITHRAPLEDIHCVLEAGADCDREVTQGLRPVHYAAFENYALCLEMLLARGARVNAADDVGYTPLHLAAKHGYVECVKLLLDYGAIPNFQDAPQGEFPLSRALGDLTVEPLNLALENNHTGVIKVLLDHGVSPNNHYFLGYEINLLPVENTGSLKLLLEHGANPDAVGRNGLTPLMKACRAQQPDAVRLLLEHKADVNKQCPPRFDQKTALHFAAMSGNQGIARMVLEAGAITGRLPEYEHTPLDLAITQDKLDVCRVLLEHGADPDEANAEECSPLQLACTAESLTHRYDIVNTLLTHGAKPNYSSPRFSYTAPSLCSIVEYFTYLEDYSVDVVRLLLKFGSRVNFHRSRLRSKITEPAGILDIVRKLKSHDDILRLLIAAADRFDTPGIQKQPHVSEEHRQILKQESRIPRSLKHSARRVIRCRLRAPLPYFADMLPLPKIMQNYILFE